ncbi:uncharacterized protein LOC121909765 isoform X2 [Thunnus maccoyii]|uniref:uncharacterized protein LOC121909765 isoform X2 n=1 Tax=Thunnus maccoyii TaxID=8240 RepID=UPI001C4CC06D|nr:uncharacterized protein LOC121909765 isoform X2 [Thunnus maccoyii]
MKLYNFIHSGGMPVISNSREQRHKGGGSAWQKSAGREWETGTITVTEGPPEANISTIFFLPIVGTNIAAVASNIHPNARIINSSLTHTIPALLNPIVYSLKTEEVLNSIKKVFKRNRLSNTTSSRKVNSLSVLY